MRPVVRQNLARPNLISFVVSHSSSSFYDLQTDRWPQVAPGTRRQDRSLASAQRATCQVITRRSASGWIPHELDQRAQFRLLAADGCRSARSSSIRLRRSRKTQSRDPNQKLKKVEHGGTVIADRIVGYISMLLVSQPGQNCDEAHSQE